jgi:hypothetical protein
MPAVTTCQMALPPARLSAPAAPVEHFSALLAAVTVVVAVLLLLLQMGLVVCSSRRHGLLLLRQALAAHVALGPPSPRCAVVVAAVVPLMRMSHRPRASACCHAADHQVLRRTGGQQPSMVPLMMDCWRRRALGSVCLALHSTWTMTWAAARAFWVPRSHRHRRGRATPAVSQA